MVNSVLEPLAVSFYLFLGELPDGAHGENFSEVEERNDEESDDDRRALISSGPIEENIVTPKNFESHISAQITTSNIPVQRLVQSIRQVMQC